MGYYKKDGTLLTKTALQALTSTVPAAAQVSFNQDVYQTYASGAGASGFEGATRLAFAQGEVVKQTDIDALFQTATFSSISPATGLAAGNTPVTIKGTNFSGASGATLGGVSLTSFKVVNDSTITGVSGAHAAGAVSLVIQDDAGNVTASNAYTST
jgi:hypothetical protein